MTKVLVTTVLVIAVSEIAKRSALVGGIVASKWTGGKEAAKHQQALSNTDAKWQEEVARLGTRMGVRGGAIEIRAPLLQMGKSDIIRLGAELGVPFELTHSCYDPTPEGAACGRCDSCLIRLEGFKAAGLRDPVPYTTT